jgi:hypothetical protein
MAAAELTTCVPMAATEVAYDGTTTKSHPEAEGAAGEGARELGLGETTRIWL